MRFLIRLAAHFVFIGGLSLFLLVPRNPYEWMRSVESATSAARIQNNSQNSVTFTLLVLFAIVMTQASLMVTTSVKKEQRISFSLIVSAVLCWLLWYWY
ncbi:hypothetical protein [Vibrio quintilis]|uniref:Uncharacterized protein n=1 Tax=Vibrio quintilis TaxID=1117707 RepID=A0A1M7YZ51_9VIBR|nr:hypothetical protein [Vibrio quintilis]SHO57921.1 hypothetical protein VQ7734_03691 [Vibrio quintilis]